MNPDKFGKLANLDQEPWKLPLPAFVEHLYVKRFGRLPDVVTTIEEIAASEMKKRHAKKERKLAVRETESVSASSIERPPAKPDSQSMS
jgi:hypothetical protein